MKKQATISIFFHNYYGNDLEWIQFFANEMTIPFHLFYNCVSGSYSRLIQNTDLNKITAQASPNLCELVIRSSTNKGKDIGGKLVLMDAYLKLGIKSDYIILLHDKISPYHSNSMQWKKDLFKIIESQYLEKVLGLFSDPQVCIVGSQNSIRNEIDNDQKSNSYTDSKFISELKNKYDIDPPHLNYIAGTMFWVRTSLFENFFKQHPPLEIRSTLEPGNVTDQEPTITHAWERFLCWIATSKGFKIKSI